MPQQIIYADGKTAGSSFYLVSSWTSDGTSFTSGPTTGSKTISYTQDLPTGSKIRSITAYARVGERFKPLTGIKSGFPKANGVTLSVVDASEDSYLCSAAIAFEDDAISTKVTYSFRANGSRTGKYIQGSLSFDDVHLVIDYEPPCSEWLITSASYEHTVKGHISGHIAINEFNKTYRHEIQAKCGADTRLLVIDPVGETYTSNTYSWYLSIPIEWMYEIPITQISTTAELILSTIDDDVVLGSSSKEVVVEQDSSASPSIDQVQFEFINPAYNENDEQIALQNYSQAKLYGAGLHGDAYGSTIQQVILECPLGATYEIEVDSSGEPIKDCTEVFQTKHIVTEAFKAPGEYPVVLRLTDSRGNIFSYWLDSDTPFAPYINVVEYSPIEILNTAQGRQGQCLENEDLDAWYARISFSFSNYTNKNPCLLTLTLIHHDGTEIPIEIGEYVSGDTVIINSSVLNCLKKDESYKLVYTITDQFTAASVSRLIGSSSTFMRWEPSNNAIGFGCYPSGDNSNCVEIAADWNLIVNGDILFPDESGTYMTLKEVIQQIISEINDQV